MNETKEVRVLIVDDHPMVRKGLAAFLITEEGLGLAGEAKDGEEAILLCQRKEPDVILMDLVMKGMGGVAAIREINQRFPQVQIIALTSFQEKKLVKEALRAGAISYLLKTASAEELGKAIMSAYAGMSTLAPEAIEALIEEERQTPLILGHDLTEREQEVLALMVEGMNNPEIADRLGISNSTVKTHVSRTLSKLGVSNRMEAIRLALQEGILSRRKIIDRPNPD